MKIRERVAGIILKENKLLMMQGESGVLWTPGGKIEEGESDEQCLRRELKEETSADLISMKFIGVVTGKSPMFKEACRNKIYLVEIGGRLKVSKKEKHVSKLVWINVKDYFGKKYKIMTSTQEKVLNFLVDKGIWK